MSGVDVVKKMNETPSLIDQLGKAFLELEAYNDAAVKVQWKEIQEHFCQLETTLVNKYLELEVREKVFNEEECNAKVLLAEKESVLAAKEQDMLDRIQDLKDAAVAAIAESWAKHHPASPDGMDGQVSSPFGDSNLHHTGQEENSSHDAGGVPGEVQPRPELIHFCKQMDAKGLLNFIMDRNNSKLSITEELSTALESAVEPGNLVLALLEGFYPHNETTTQGENRNDAAFRGLRQSCLMILEAMANLLAKADSGADHLLKPDIKQHAKVIADGWKPNLADASTDAANGNSLEAEAFLQLLATFRIASEFDEEELCKLVLAVAYNRRAPELSRSLGLTHKIPGIVEALISGGKQIEAVHFVHAFQLTERYPTVPILKTYLKDLRRNSQGKGSNSGGATVTKNDGNALELAALRAVIHCVRSYKLEDEYPLDPLKRRVAQLDKLKPEKKRYGESGRHQQSKRPRTNVGHHALRPPAPVASRHVPPVLGDRSAYAGTLETYPPVVPNTYGYHAPTSQSVYTHPAYDQRSYYYPQDDRVNATPYSAAPSNYGSYMSTGMQPSNQPYM